jgi:chromosome segregation ATPase
MKITSIKDITDENLKELSASAISDFIEEELKEASVNYSAEKQEIEKSLDATKGEMKTLREDSEKTNDELKQVKDALEGLEAEKVEREAEEAFNLHMATLDEEYELNDEDREVIASDIKDMNEAAFEDYRKKVSVLLRDKNKKAIEAALAAVEEKTKTTEEEAKADTTDKVEESKEAEETVDEVLDSAEAEATEVPVSTTVEEPSVYDKYRKAFSVENWIN